MKKIVLKTILFTGIVCCNFLSANGDHDDYIEFSKNEVFIPQKLGDIKLYKDVDGFHVIKDAQVYNIQNCFCDPLLRRMTNKQLLTFLGRNKPQVIMITPEELAQINEDDLIEITGKERDRLMANLLGSGYISVSQMSDGEYSLQAEMRLLGGSWKNSKLRVFAVTTFGAIVLATAEAIVGVFAAYGLNIPLFNGALAGALFGGGCTLIAALIRGQSNGMLENKKERDNNN